MRVAQPRFNRAGNLLTQRKTAVRQRAETCACALVRRAVPKEVHRAVVQSAPLCGASFPLSCGAAAWRVNSFGELSTFRKSYLSGVNRSTVADSRDLGKKLQVLRFWERAVFNGHFWADVSRHRSLKMAAGGRVGTMHCPSL